MLSIIKSFILGILKSLFLGLLFFTVYLAKAQSYSVSGIVKEKDTLALPYANILLLKIQDSTLVKGTTSNEDGLFTFYNITKGNYVLKTSFVGYKTAYKTISVTKNTTAIELFLQENLEALDGVEIVVRKPKIKIGSGRLTFNVENTSLVEGSILQLLNSTPRVLITGQDIKIKNKLATVYINGKKVKLTGEELSQLLESSPANNVKSIEVISNPSSAYDADTGGVLNIIMAKNLITGYHGSAFANYTQGVFSRTNYGINNFYKNSKINVFASYNYGKNKINRDDFQRTNFLDNTTVTQQWNSNFNRETDSETHNFNVNFDYAINKASTLSISVNGQILPYFEYQTRGNTSVVDAVDSPLFNFTSIGNTSDDRDNVNYSIDYTYNFKNNSQLSLSANYTDYDYQRTQGVNSEYFSATNTLDSITAFTTLSRQDTDFFTYTLDYTLPIDENTVLKVGAKASDIESSSAIIQNNIENGISILDANNTDNFVYDEKIYATYITVDKTWNKWSFSGGLRFEHTDIEGVSVLLGDVNTQDYSELFPTVDITYEFSENLSVYANYKRSLERPNYSSLNPFRFFLTDNIIVSGNPQLQPIFENNIALGASFLKYFSAEVYYNTKEDNIIQIPFQDNDNNLIVFTQTNLGETRDFGVSADFYYDINSRWSLSSYATAYNIEDSSVFNNQRVIQDQWTFFLAIDNTFSFLKDNSLNATFSTRYASKRLEGLEIVDDVLITNLSLSKRILKNKAVISLSISDLFNQQDTGITTRFSGQDSFRFSDVDNRFIKLGFRYKFGNTKLETNENIKELEEKDRLQSLSN